MWRQGGAKYRLGMEEVTPRVLSQNIGRVYLGIYNLFQKSGLQNNPPHLFTHLCPQLPNLLVI